MDCTPDWTDNSGVQSKTLANFGVGLGIALQNVGVLKCPDTAFRNAKMSSRLAAILGIEIEISLQSDWTWMR